MAHRFGLKSTELEPGEIVRDMPPGGFSTHMPDLWPMLGSHGQPMVHMPPGMLHGMPPQRPGIFPPGMLLPPPPGLGGMGAFAPPPPPGPDLSSLSQAMFHHHPLPPPPQPPHQPPQPPQPPQHKGPSQHQPPQKHASFEPQPSQPPHHPQSQLPPQHVQVSPPPPTRPMQNSTPQSSHSTTPKEIDENALDVASAKGIFGWTTIDGVNFPYLVRDKRTYLSVRMVEQKLLSKYPSMYPEELKKRPPLMSHYITEDEAKLLNEINVEHCAYEYGRHEFKTQKDLIVSEIDFEEFYSIVKKHFPDHVIKSMRKSSSSKLTVDGGWLQINNTVVPYVIRTSMKMLPLAVIRYAAGLLTNTKVEGITPTPDECAYLNHSCSKAGLKFNFESSSKLLAEPLLFTYTERRPTVLELPKDDPFGHAQYQDSTEKDKQMMHSPPPVQFGATLPTNPFNPGMTHQASHARGPGMQEGVGNFWMNPHMGVYPGSQPPASFRGPHLHGHSPPLRKRPEHSSRRASRAKDVSTTTATSSTSSSSLSLQALKDLTRNYQDTQMTDIPPRNPFPPSEVRSAGSRLSMISGETFSGPPPLIPISETHDTITGERRLSKSSVHKMSENPANPQEISIPPLVIAPTSDHEVTQCTTTTKTATVSSPPHATTNGSPASSTNQSGARQASLSESPVTASETTTPSHDLSSSTANSSTTTTTTSSTNSPTPTAQPTRAKSTSPQCGDKIRPVEYHNKTISCLVKNGENFALVEALSRVYFSYCSLEEFSYALDSVLHMDISELTRREEQSFIAFYGLPTSKLKCNKIVKLDIFDKYMAQLKYMFREKEERTSEKGDGALNRSNSKARKKQLNENDSAADTAASPDNSKSSLPAASSAVAETSQDSNNNAAEDKRGEASSNTGKRSPEPENDVGGKRQCVLQTDTAESRDDAAKGRVEQAEDMASAPTEAAAKENNSNSGVVICID